MDHRCVQADEEEDEDDDDDVSSGPSSKHSADLAEHPAREMP